MVGQSSRAAPHQPNSRTSRTKSHGDRCTADNCTVAENLIRLPSGIGEDGKEVRKRLEKDVTRRDYLDVLWHLTPKQKRDTEVCCLRVS
jgi:hypothetical protein